MKLQGGGQEKKGAEDFTPRRSIRLESARRVLMESQLEATISGGSPKKGRPQKKKRESRARSPVAVLEIRTSRATAEILKLLSGLKPKSYKCYKPF